MQAASAAQGTLREIFPDAPPELVEQVTARCGDIARAAEVLALPAPELQQWLQEAAPESPAAALQRASGWADPGEVRRVLQLTEGDTARAFDVLTAGPECVRQFLWSKRPLECPICFCEAPADDMYCVGCGEADHCTCQDCAMEMARSALRERSNVRCPHKGCGYPLSSEDVQRMLWRPEEFPAIQRQHTDVLLRDAIGALNCVPCPSPGCTNWVELMEPAQRQAVTCTHCWHLKPRPPTAVFCSRCGAPHHYEVECADVARLTVAWISWCSRGRGEAHERWRAEGRAVTAAEARQQQRAVEMREAWERLRQDEEWKHKNCRLCPGCGALIQRATGCSMMACGTSGDAGWGVWSRPQVQGGCGRRFLWDFAEKYRAAPPGEEPPPLPASSLGPWQDWAGVACRGCRRTVSGPRFQCIHCKSADYCYLCEEQAAAAEEHRGHVFRITAAPPPAAAQEDSLLTSANFTGAAIFLIALLCFTFTWSARRDATVFWSTLVMSGVTQQGVPRTQGDLRALARRTLNLGAVLTALSWPAVWVLRRAVPGTWG